MSANPLPQPNDTETQIRLAVQTERLGVMIERFTQSELRNEQWRRETTLAIDALRVDIADLKVSHRELTARLGDVEKEVIELKAEVQAKVGTIWFRSIWSIMLGLGVLFTAMGGIVTMVKALGWIH